MVDSSAVLQFFAKEPRKVRTRLKSDLLGSRKSVKKPEDPSATKALAGLVRNVIARGQKMTRKSGTVLLIPGNQAFLDHHNVIRLETQDNVLLLKVDKDKSASEIPVVAGQWVHALRQCLAMVSMAVREQDFQSKMSMTFYSPALRQNNPKAEGKANEVPIPTEFSQVLDNKVLRDEFFDYLRLVQATENLLFHEEADKFKKQTDALYRRTPPPRNREFEIRKHARKIYDKFICEDSDLMVNISSSCRSEITAKFVDYEEKKKAGKVTADFSKEPTGILSPNLFKDAKSEVYLLMEANFFHGFYKDLSKRTGCFSNLVYRYELSGYNAVYKNHFGSVRTENDRLIKRFQGRLDQINAELDMIASEPETATEVTVKEFETSTEVVRNLYSLSSSKFKSLDVLRKVMEKQISELKDADENVNSALKKIHKTDKPKLEKYQKILKDKQIWIRYKQKCDASYLDYKRKVIDIEQLGQRFKREDVTEENLEEIRTLIEQKYQKSNIELAKQKDTLKGELTLSLDELEKIDLRRLARQQEICQKILRAEKQYLLEVKEQLLEFTQGIQRINSKQDVKMLAHGLINKS